MKLKQVINNIDDILLYISFIGAAILVVVSQIYSVSIDRKLDFILGIMVIVATSILLERHRRLNQIKSNTENLLEIYSSLLPYRTVSHLFITRQGLPGTREMLKDATHVSICGKSLVNFVRSNRLLIEELAKKNCKFSFLLINPYGAAAPMVVESSVSEQNIEMFENSIRSTVFNLDEIITNVGEEKVHYKFIDYLLPFSLFIVERQHSPSEIHVELYTYKTSSSFRPMFIVHEDQDKQLFRTFQKQFSLFWNRADPNSQVVSKQRTSAPPGVR